jgi:hypothetical protein
VESVYRQWIAPPDWRYLMEKARCFPFVDAPGYALKYMLNLLKRPNSHFHKTWGPRYQGIDEDVATKDLFEVCAIQWSRSVEKAYAALEKIESSRKLLIRYEDFVGQPEEHLVAIANFLAVDPAPYQDRIVLSRVSPDNVGKGRNQLTNIQQKVVMPHIDQMLTQFGY